MARSEKDWLYIASGTAMPSQGALCNRGGCQQKLPARGVLFGEDVVAVIGCDSPTSRDAIHGPHTTNVDFALLKHFNVIEHQTVTFEANFFNVFNHANFGDIDGNITDGSKFGNGLSSTDPRIIQFALRYDF